MGNIPKDPNMLYSYVNMGLRDGFETLDDFCASKDVLKEDILSVLEAAGYYYDEGLNQFR